MHTHVHFYGILSSGPDVTRLGSYRYILFLTDRFDVAFKGNVQFLRQTMCIRNQFGSPRKQCTAKNKRYNVSPQYAFALR
jgi:hypothetical protein